MPDEARDLSTISPEDVEAVTERLTEWGQTLTEQEQLVLGWVLTRAAAADDKHANAYAERMTTGDVPVSALVAEAAGLQTDDVSGFAIARPPWGPPPTWAFKFG